MYYFVCGHCLYRFSVFLRTLNVREIIDLLKFPIVEPGAKVVGDDFYMLQSADDHIFIPDEDGAKTGGYKFVQLNLEYIFPLVKKAGLVGVVFYDTGNVYGKDESVDLGSLRQSAGAGFRWYSPLGPIRLEYGYILDRKDTDEDSGQWEFSMGAAF